MDKIEKIFENESDWDVAIPPLGHVSRFEDKLEFKDALRSKSKSKYNLLYQYAAIVMLIAGLSIVWKFQIFPEKSFPQAITDRTMQSQNYFENEIKNQWQKIQQNSNVKTQLIIADAMKQLHQLDNDYNLIIKDINVNGENDILFDALIKNCQTRLNFLIDLKEKIRIINQDNKTQYEDQII